MAHDSKLEQWVDDIVADQKWQLSKAKMFGSMAYKSGERLCFCVQADGLLLRGAGTFGEHLRSMPGATPAVMGKRSMKNWWQVTAAVITDDEILKSLLTGSKDFADSLEDK